MKIESPNDLDREGVLEAVRSAVTATGKKRISFKNFIAWTGVTRHVVGRYFSRWNHVLEAAGFDEPAHNFMIDSEVLLADWGSLTRKLGRPPTKGEHRIEGKINPVTFQRRFKGWHNVPGAFRDFARDKPEWADVLPLIPSSEQSPPRRPIIRRIRPRKSIRGRKSICFGPSLDFGALRYAPVNEQGVVFLFGMLAEKLGFMVDALRAAFPDCEAMRRLGPNGWERVNIEFEYESRNFCVHGHDAAGCDLIVYWEHNWPECPVEVLVLKEEIPKLTTVV